MRAAADTNLVEGAQTLAYYPWIPDLESVLLAHQPEVLLVSLQSFDRAIEVITRAIEVLPDLHILVVGDPELEHFSQLIRPEISGLITLPVTAEKVATALIRLRQASEKAASSQIGSDRIFAFLPAKAGAGASTAALNTALALKRAGLERVLLADFDLSNGLIDFMLRAESRHSVGDVFDNLHRLDADNWSQLVAHVQGVEFLRSPRLFSPQQYSRSNIRILIDFVRRQYKAVVLDLPGNLDQTAMDLLPESSKLLIVSTLEPSSLRLAREKVQFLRDLGLGERVRLLLNRCPRPRSAMLRGAFAQLSDVEEIVGLPPLATFTNDFGAVQSALVEGKGVPPRSVLGEQYNGLVARLLETKPVPAPKARRKFFEHLFLPVTEPAKAVSR